MTILSLTKMLLPRAHAKTHPARTPCRTFRHCLRLVCGRQGRSRRAEAQGSSVATASQLSDAATAQADPMHAPPLLRGSVVVRSVSLVAGLFLFALGIVLLLESGLGLAPWDVLN